MFCACEPSLPRTRAAGAVCLAKRVCSGVCCVLTRVLSRGRGLPVFAWILNMMLHLALSERETKHSLDVSLLCYLFVLHLLRMAASQSAPQSPATASVWLYHFSQLPRASLAVHLASTSGQRLLRTAVEVLYLAFWEGVGTSVQEPWLEACRQQCRACQTHSLAALHSRVGGGRKCFVCARLNEVAHKKSSMPFSSSGLWQIQEDSDMFVPRQS